MQTYLKFALGDIDFGVVGALGELEVNVATAAMLGYPVVKLLPELTSDGFVLWNVLVELRLLQDLVNGAVGKLLEGGLEAMGDGLVDGFEMALALIGGLDAGICKALCAASARAAAAGFCCGRLGCGDCSRSCEPAAASASSAAAATPAPAAAASSRLASGRLILSSHGGQVRRSCTDEEGGCEEM